MDTTQTPDETEDPKDILYHFALEEHHSPQLLTRYIRDYPHLKSQLIHLALDIMCPEEPDEISLDLFLGHS